MINTMLQTSMGDFYFDAVFKTEHNSNMVITEHPIQTGAPVADHAYMEPEEVSVEIGMTDVNGEGLSVQMYEQLRELMALREPFTLVTRLHSYNDMIIASMSVPDDYTTMLAMKASIVFKQVRVVSVALLQPQQTVSSSKTDASGGTTGATQTQASGEKTIWAGYTEKYGPSVLADMLGGTKVNSSKNAVTVSENSNVGAKLKDKVKGKKSPNKSKQGE